VPRERNNPRYHTGARARGRAKTIWLSNIRHWGTMEELLSTVKDRQRKKTVVYDAVNPGTEDDKEQNRTLMRMRWRRWRTKRR